MLVQDKTLGILRTSCREVHLVEEREFFVISINDKKGGDEIPVIESGCMLNLNLREKFDHPKLVLGILMEDAE